VGESEKCTHGNKIGTCETCAAWESAIHNQHRAEKAERECDALRRRVTELEAVKAK
jgi:hypothetical protein